jgi:hypothetical protein
MGCGCNNKVNLVDLESSRKIKSNQLVNKRIVDVNGNELLVISPIQDVYGDVIGYITKNEEGKTVRIFAKNVQKILN